MIRKVTICFLFSILHFSLLLAQQHKADSLCAALKTEKDDTNKIKTLNAIAVLLTYSKPDSTVLLAKQANTLAEKLGWKKGNARACNLVGNGYFVQGDYPKALDYYLRSLKIDEDLGDKLSQAGALGNISYVYTIQRDWLKSLDYSLRSLKIDEQMGDKVGEAIVLGSIGSLYMSQDNFRKALDYCTKALRMGEELGNKQVQAANLSNLGTIYSSLADTAKHSKIGLDSLNNRSLSYYLNAVKIQEEIGDERGLAYDLGSMAYVYAREGNCNEGEKYLKKAIAIDSSIGDLNYVMQFEGNLSNMYDNTGVYKPALEYYKKAMAIKDTLFNIDKNKAITRKELTYQYEKKEALAKAEQDRKDAIAEADKKKQRIVVYSILVGLLLALVLAAFIFRSLRITSKQKQLIEIKNAETERQKKLIEQQKLVVEEKNKDILDSITYAKRLQDAILPPLSIIKKYLPESFVFYKPKDIVAGDFYWMEHQGEVVLIAACDCTGHGVPGALVSVVCSNALNRTVKEFKITEPGKILDKVRELVLETFEKSENNVQDGMDISLCCINTKTNEVQWSGAYNSLWYIQNGEMKETAADKQSIGKTDRPLPFNTSKLNLKKGDTLYLFTDGYADQFGGPQGKKFKYKQLMQLIMDNAKLTMEVQKNMLEQTLNDWKGKLDQVDDVLIIGVKV